MKEYYGVTVPYDCFGFFGDSFFGCNGTYCNCTCQYCKTKQYADKLFHKISTVLSGTKLILNFCVFLSFLEFLCKENERDKDNQTDCGGSKEDMRCGSCKNLAVIVSIGCY